MSCCTPVLRGLTRHEPKSKWGACTEDHSWKLIMASQSRVVPPHLRRPLPGSGAVHPDPYGSAIRPPHGGFPPFEMLPPPEVMEQKLSAQHIEIEKLATENRRLAATHGSLRQDLAMAKHELQLVHAHISDMKTEKEHQTRGIIDKMSMMEAELEAAERIKMELQQARAEAQNLVSARKELISKVQQLTRDLQMAHSEAQQMPALMSELDSLRQEYQHCRATYDYEKKLYHDHLESLQVMEKNYMSMTREVDKLRTELINFTNFDPRTGGPYGGSTGYSESVPIGNYASVQNAYGGAQQGQSPLLGGVGGGGAAGTASSSGGATVVGGNSPRVVAQFPPSGSGSAHDASRLPGYNASRGTDYDPHRGHVGVGYDSLRGPGPAYNTQRGPTGPGYETQRVPPTGSGYEAQRGQSQPGYDAQRGPTGPGYDTHRGQMGPGSDTQRRQTGPGYDAQRGSAGPGYEVKRTPGYDADKGPSYGGQRMPAYDMPKGSGNDVQSGANFAMQKGPGYDTSSRTGVGHPGQVPMNNTPYVSTTPSARAGAENESTPRGGNPPRR